MRTAGGLRRGKIVPALVGLTALATVIVLLVFMMARQPRTATSAGTIPAVLPGAPARTASPRRTPPAPMAPSTTDTTSRDHGQAEPARDPEADARDAGGDAVREELADAGETAWVEDVTASPRTGDGYDVNVIVSVQDENGATTRRRYHAHVAAAEDEATDPRWHASLTRDPSDLSDQEWTLIERGLQQRAMTQIRDAMYADLANVRINATPLGRGRFDVVVIYQNPREPTRLATDFMTAAYDPVYDRWTFIAP